MQGREFGLYIYTSMRIHLNDIRICVYKRICKYELASLVRVYAKMELSLLIYKREDTARPCILHMYGIPLCKP